MTMQWIKFFTWISLAAVLMSCPAVGQQKKDTKKPASTAPATPKSDTIFKKAFEAHVAGNQQQAIELFEFGLKSAPKDGNAWYFLGVAKLAATDFDGALEAIGRARGLGSPIQNARATQIYDEMVAVQRANRPPMIMRDGWTSVLAQALRLYQPPSERRYRITSETTEYAFDDGDFAGKRLRKKRYLAGCGMSGVPQGYEGAVSLAKHTDILLEPRLIRVAGQAQGETGGSSRSGAYCIDGKLVEYKEDPRYVLMETPGAAVFLGAAGKESLVIGGKLSITGNPFRLAPGAVWSVSDEKTREREFTMMFRGTYELVDTYSGRKLPIWGRIFRIDSEHLSVDEAGTLILKVKSSRVLADDPAAPAYGVMREYRGESSSTSSGPFQTSDTSEEVTSLRGDLNAAGSVLEYALEQKSNRTKVQSNVRIERIR